MNGKRRKNRDADEFGDFQTPTDLASAICQLLLRRNIAPASIVEPTCGVGNFVLAAHAHFSGVPTLGVELKSEYVERLRSALRERGADHAKIIQQSFFEFDWPAALGAMREPILIIGNPPWVTNSRLAVLRSANLPTKANRHGWSGMDALTGKSNFDISEWMLTHLLESLAGRRGWLAVLCKTAVARKTRAHRWRNGVGVDWAEIRTLDAREYFAAAVDACLLICAVSPSGNRRECEIYDQFDGSSPERLIGWRDAQLVANVHSYERWKHLLGSASSEWRSGVKHDCSSVMELRRDSDGVLSNSLGERVDVESEFVFPMLKSSELANGRSEEPTRWMLIPQRAIGEDTRGIAAVAPNTWRYLQAHAQFLDRRASSIYKNRPRFSVFGVGEYTFAPWKVAISGFYKRFHFSVVGSFQGKPIVLDDTGYFVPCEREEQARRLAGLLNSDVASEFLDSLVFWDSKRPITIDLLRRLDLSKLARHFGEEDSAVWGKPRSHADRQLGLFVSR